MQHVAPNTLESEGDKATRRKLRARIGCELLLAELFKHHKDHAGIEYRVVDVEPAVPEPADVTPLPVPIEEKLFAPLPTVNQIVRRVGAFYDISPLEMVSHRRHTRPTFARQICMYLARQLTLLSYPQIGRAIHRDHTCVMHGADKIAAQIKTDARLADEIEVLKLHIRQDALRVAA